MKMKAYVVKISLLVPLLIGLFVTSSSADTNSNPSPQEMNKLLTETAIKYDIPPEIVKAVASVESNWRQFNDKGEPLISNDGGIGIMQITGKKNLDQNRLMYDTGYNIEQGVIILQDNYNRTDLPKIKGADRKVIENWYFPVMAYNGTKPVNSPLVQRTGERNTAAYQEKVFTEIEKNRGRELADYPFATVDFAYNPNSTENIKFMKLAYALTEPINTSHSVFTENSKVIVTGSSVKLREKPGTTSRVIKTIAKDTILTVTGGIEYDLNQLSQNHFVWYPVTMSNGVKGYMASSYLDKYVLTGDNVTNQSKQ